MLRPPGRGVRGYTLRTHSLQVTNPFILRGAGSSVHLVAPRYNGAEMIAHLRGKLLAKHPNQVIVETAGVGYDVTITVPTFSDLPETGREVALHIHTHVREDALALYGFLRSAEKLLFEKLITVSGIGPKLAITILSGMAADEMVRSIRGNDIARLTRIPGIGRKTAERMVLELSYFQGYTHSEIAAISGLPLGTVKSSMRLGLQALKRELMQSGAQETAC